MIHMPQTAAALAGGICAHLALCYGAMHRLFRKGAYFLVRLAAYYRLEPRLRRPVTIRPRAMRKLKRAQKELSAVYDEARLFFEDVGLCRTCSGECCSGNFSRFTVFDHVSHIAGGVEDPMEWGYRLYPFRSYERNCRSEGWCPGYIVGRGCRLDYRLRPAICIWFVCRRMELALDADQKAFVRRLRHRIEKAHRAYAFSLLMGAIERDGASGYLALVREAMEDFLALGRSGNMRRALQFIWRRIWSTSDMAIYECQASTMAHGAPPEGVCIVKVDAGNRSQHEANIVKAGTGWDMRYFKRKAVCYLAYVGDEPAGIGWRFPSSRLLRRIGRSESDAYLAGFHVVEAFRGRGLYPALLGAACHDVAAPGVSAFAETGLHNVASQRGLAKAGFVPIGRLRTRVLAGFILRWEVLPWTL